jgi:hypothetical protein
MKRYISLLFVWHVAILSYAQKQPQWGLRLGLSSTEDKIGFGASYYPAGSKWFHHAEVYPIQNRGSDITKDPKNFGFLLRTNYKINSAEKRFNLTTGAEGYYSRYERIIVGSPNDEPDLSQVTQLMAIAGLNLRLGKRLNIDFSIPVIGVRLEDDDGDSRTRVPFLGFYGWFQPKGGIQISLF